MAPAVTAYNLSKCYEINALKKGRDLPIIPAVVDGLKTLLRLPGTASGDNRLWALKDVSFEILQGESVGFIGRNGAGKSTLLKLISRITDPTSGTAAVYGRTLSLLEAGSGFHAELTGRENIYLSGSILGMKKREINRKFDEIVAFSGVEKQLDTPVKYYSSGQYVRLGFSVAAHLEQDILIIDEILAVGDAEFRGKCHEKINQLLTCGKTIISVAHDHEFLQRVCDRLIWLEHGRIIDSGDPDTVLKRYLASPHPVLVEAPAAVG